MVRIMLAITEHFCTSISSFDKLFSDDLKKERKKKKKKIKNSRNIINTQC